jgi:hypothetical protein
MTVELGYSIDVGLLWLSSLNGGLLIKILVSWKFGGVVLFILGDSCFYTTNLCKL